MTGVIQERVHSTSSADPVEKELVPVSLHKARSPPVYTSFQQSMCCNTSFK